MLVKWLTIPSERSLIRPAATSWSGWPDGPATVGEATRDLGASKPTLSRHLKILEEAGVVVRVIDGRTHRLSLDVDPLEEAQTWLARQRANWERLFDVVEDYLEERG